jgi:hypothetical protein
MTPSLPSHPCSGILFSPLFSPLYPSTLLPIPLCSAYFKYEMEMSTYVLEPAEKLMFNTIVLSITIGTAYFAYTLCHP